MTIPGLSIRAKCAIVLLITLHSPLAESEPGLWPAINNPHGTSPEIEQRIDELMALMSAEQKVGQIIQADIRYAKPKDVRKYHLGSVLNGGGAFPNKNKHAKPGDWLALADDFYHASMDTSAGRLAIPVIWGTDAVHGHNNVIGATLFPHNIGLGATRNPGLIRRIGEITATEVAVTGIPWTFAPTVAVARDDRWGRTYESWSEDPGIIRQFAGQMVTGLQGDVRSDNFLGPGHILATAKHFLGDGGTLGGKDQGDTLLSENELVRVHAQGYISSLQAGVQTIMASFNSWNGIKMHGNSYLLTRVLKHQMGFDGLVVGDWNGHGQLNGCTNKSCAPAINAGIDLVMVPKNWKAFYRNTLKQVRKGEIHPYRLDDAVRRVLRVKIRAGMFDKGAPSSWPFAGEIKHLGSAEHRATARQAVRESLVLLKNDQQLLPLKPQLKVLVAGPGADNIGMQTGGWSLTWQGTENRNEDFPGATSIFSGIEKAVSNGGGTAVLSESGRYEHKPDVAIVVWGESPYAEYEGDLRSVQYHRGHTRELEMLQSFRADNIPVVSVFISGRPLWVKDYLQASDAFVAVWLPGSEGDGIADVLFRSAQGDIQYDFTGRLPFSWPARADQADLNINSENYEPLFEYGFGLSVLETSK
jgi:beta-glucosidase